MKKPSILQSTIVTASLAIWISASLGFLVSCASDASTPEPALDSPVPRGPAREAYSLASLKAELSRTERASEVLAFRERPNPRRKGLERLELKYLDIYFPGTAEGSSYAEVLKESADLAYLFLMKFYELDQIPIEIHLIEEKEAERLGLDEGLIRRREHVTFVYINDEHTKWPGNAVHELVHEMNHSFFTVKNGVASYTTKYRLFVDEGLARNIGDIFLELVLGASDSSWYSFPLHKEFDSYLKYYGERMARERYIPQLEEIAQGIGNWAFSSEKEILRIDSVIFFWYYVYRVYGIETYAALARSMGTADYERKVGFVLGRPLKEVYSDFQSYVSDL